ncbi:MAG: DHA2 family efflux MFS transporter permease subunit [Methanocalculus sp.]|uniref:DHA2 family efflux MFS transporter permease subunit n=1 Tax=Methanocalculus sp. TaxID=2004547 RepID=UPI002726468E|nr:DHA2 family efflux MFS transporter permease subunit [Methanocalculus sp.]MDO9539387.1 DHA2 family efflux MFS transporter permease subunit [Methanocalculus sp.]
MAVTQERQKMTPGELLIVLVISLGSFMAGLDATIVNIALPSIAGTFGVSTVDASWVLNAYLIILVSLLLVSARLGDIRGYRKVFLGGFVIFTIGSALCGMAPNLTLLIASRMLQAIGGAVIAALGAVMVTSYLSPSLRGQALGIVAMFTMLGAALGPVLGGFLTSALSWHFIFYVNLPVGIIAILIGLHTLPTLHPVAPDAQIDKSGVLLVFLALGTLIYGLTSLQGEGRSSAVISLVASALFWVIFYLREKKITEPLFNLSLFSNRQFTLQNISILLINLALAGVMILMPFYLELIKKLPTDNAGTILLVLPVGMILMSPIAGRVSDVIGTKKPIIIGFVICTLALLLLSTIGPDTTIGHVQAYLFILGAGTGIAYAPLNSAVMGESPKEERGSTSGLIKMMTNLGSSLGVALVMLVATSAMGPKLVHTSAHTLPPSELAGAFHVAFLFLMCIEILGILLMIPVKEKKDGYSTDGEPVISF